MGGVGLDTAGYLYKCVLAGDYFFTIKQLDPGQRRQTGADFDANHFHGVVFSVFPEVCSLSDFGNIADSDQVLRKVGSGWTL